MKKIILTLAIGLMALAAHAASYTYYAQLKAIAAPQAGGLVYADTVGSTAAPAMAAQSTSPNPSTEKPNIDLQFTAVAEAQTGYGFLGWSDTESGFIFSRENPLTISVSTAVDNNQTNLRTIYARFSRLQTAEIGFLPYGNTGGTYTAIADGEDAGVEARYTTTIETESPISLQATPDEGKKFFGWYTLDDYGKRQYFSYDNPLSDYPMTEDCEMGATFVDEDTPIFRVEGSAKRYQGLQEAVAAANGQQATIILEDGGTVHGTVNIPQGLTLLIPFDTDNHLYREMPRGVKALNTPEEYIRLTLAQDAVVNISGEVSISAKMRAGGGGSTTGCGNVDGAYGRMHLQAGATLNLLQGGKLYCWGYLTGQGEVIAKSGSDVYEPFHFPGFRGGSIMSDMGSSQKRVFPVNQYYIQNIEAPLTIEYGANAHVGTTAFADGEVQNATAVFIGAGGLYQPQEGARVKKSYDPQTDRVAYDIWGNTTLKAFNLSIAGYIINSDAYVLPITNNMSIRIHSGNTQIVNDIALLPGADLTIDAAAQVTIGSDSRAYVYDKDEWLLGQFAYPGQLAPAIFSPTRSHTRTVAALQDAKVDINGQLRLAGQLYTTAGNADITSTAGTGQLLINSAPVATAVTYQAEQLSGLTFTDINCHAAMLHNAATYAGDAYFSTADAAVGASAVYRGDHWTWLGESLTGDVNQDGSVDVSDISVLAEYIFGNEPTVFDEEAADANGDGYIDVSDISTIAEIIFGE